MGTLPPATVGMVPIAVAQFVGRVVGDRAQGKIDFDPLKRSLAHVLASTSTPSADRFTLQVDVRDIRPDVQRRLGRTTALAKKNCFDKSDKDRCVASNFATSWCSCSNQFDS